MPIIAAVALGGRDQESIGFHDVQRHSTADGLQLSEELGLVPDFGLHCGGVRPG